jgi:hypothetical protein
MNLMIKLIRFRSRISGRLVRSLGEEGRITDDLKETLYSAIRRFKVDEICKADKPRRDLRLLAQPELAIRIG